MLNDKKSIGLVVAFVLLAGVAVAGWVRHTSGPTPINANGIMSNGPDYSSQTPGSYAAIPAPNSYTPNARPNGPGMGTDVSNRAYSGESGYANQYAGSYQQDGYYSSTHRPIYVRQNVPDQVIVEQQPRETVYENRGTERVYRTERHHGRSTGKSVAIVAGSAGAGAAIGALAGGGKGAAIGAISGGGAGFIYDRLTHKH